MRNVHARLPHLRRVYPRLVTAYDALDKVTTMQEFENWVATYNQVAHEAANAFYEDTKAYNSRETVISAFAGCQRHSMDMANPPRVYDQYLETEEEAQAHEARSREAAGRFMKLLSTMADAALDQLSEGRDEKELWETMRDSFVQAWELPSLQAANLTRIVFALVCAKYGKQLYTPAEFAAIVRKALPATPFGSTASCHIGNAVQMIN